MKGWRHTKLGDLLTIEHGFAFKGEYFTDAGDFVVLTPGNFHEAGGFRARPGKDRSYLGKFPDRYLLNHNDLIVAMTEQGEGLLGSSALIPESGKFLHNQRIGLVHPKETADRRFLYYLFNCGHVRQQIRNSSAGTKIRHTSPGRIYRTSVCVPDKSNQSRIAAILSAYDELIETNQRRIALLEKLAEEIYREWFVRLRFPGHEKVKKIKGVPEGWKTESAHEAFQIMGGGTPKTEIPVYWDGDVPFFTPKDSHVGFYALKTEKTITEKGLESCNSQLFPRETIFITARGTVGELCLAHTPMAMNQSCYALAPKNSGAVYFHFLALKMAIAYLKGISKSGVFDNVVIDTFKKLPIQIPTSGLVREFSDLVGPMFHQVGNILVMNTHLTRTRDLLLPRLISGKLSVEKLDIAFPPGMECP